MDKIQLASVVKKMFSFLFVFPLHVPKGLTLGDWCQPLLKRFDTLNSWWLSDRVCMCLNGSFQVSSVFFRSLTTPFTRITLLFKFGM